jgi:cytochrome c oxidase cbb3-type subunit IV
MHLDFDLMSSLVTVVWFLAFIGVWVWAWSSRRAGDFAAAARMPLEESTGGGASDGQGSE